MSGGVWRKYSSSPISTKTALSHAEGRFCGDAPLLCSGALLCLGALPLLYPAAPPSVFAFGKYTAPAVALGREYVVGFWVVMVWIYLDERRRVALLGPHRVWGFSFWHCLWIFNPLAERLTAAAIYA